MDAALRARLEATVEEYERLSREMSTQEVASDPDQYRQYAKAQADLEAIVENYRAYQAAQQAHDDAIQMLQAEDDPEIHELAEQEREQASARMEELEKAVRLLLLPKDPYDEKNTIVEIRAGTGGDEAALFAADLYRMYCRYAELKGWRIEELSAHGTGLGGYKEVSFKITGDSVYSQLKYEAGVHRVQRVPETETQGRVHTSAVTVAVLPEAEAVELEIDPNDLRIDVFRSSGQGGQHVNTTDSAVRITHLPTNTVVSCQDEKSQHKNKAKALTVLRARLLAKKTEEEAAQRSDARRSQVGSGDRSERIRTYNFPQNRVTDHRINLTLYNLDRRMEGEIQEIIDALIATDRAERLAHAVS